VQVVAAHQQRELAVGRRHLQALAHRLDQRHAERLVIAVMRPVVARRHALSQIVNQDREVQRRLGGQEPRLFQTQRHMVKGIDLWMMVRRLRHAGERQQLGHLGGDHLQAADQNLGGKWWDDGSSHNRSIVPGAAPRSGFPLSPLPIRPTKTAARAGSL